MDFFILTDSFLYLGCFVVGTFLFLCVATYSGILVAIPLLEKYGCYAVRNAGSHHKGKIPHGAGLVVIAIALGTLLSAKLLNLFLPPKFDSINLYRFADPDSTTLSLTFFGILFFLCLSSFTDDLKPKSVVYRLSLHFVAAAFVVRFLPGEVLLGYVPYAVDKLFALFFVVTFANFMNFLDGCDGMCGTQIVSICVGLLAVGAFALGISFNTSVGFPALVLGAVMTGFLLLNWQPARIFLGDAGSIPVGFFLALLLLMTSSHGYWEVAVILPLYGYCDAGITLLRRILKREKFWQPHKKHFFRQAIEKGRKPREVVRATAFVNVCLIGLALYALRDDSIVYDLGVIAVALLLVAILLWWMESNLETTKTIRKKNVRT